MENEGPVGPPVCRIWLSEFCPYLVRAPDGCPPQCSVNVSTEGLVWKVILERNVISEGAWDYFEISRSQIGQTT